MRNTENPSLPTRGAWIEMARLHAVPVARRTSLPTRGAWIEIAIERINVDQIAISRSPRGERG